MRSIIKYLSALAFFAVLCCSCENINDVHAKYLQRGEEIYTGVIDSLEATPGNERVKFRWQVNADPRITKVLIYWNDYADSVVVDVHRTYSGPMWMEEIITFPEDSYNLNFVTKDDEGHRSMPVEIALKVYGPNYISSLINREILNKAIDESGQGVLSWGAIGNTALLYTTVKYTDYSQSASPVERIVRVDNDETNTILPGVRKNDRISVSSSFQPEGALDIFVARESIYSF